MEAKIRPASTGINTTLVKAPSRSFFQSVRELQKNLRRDAIVGGWHAVGHDGDPRKEPVRFKSAIGMGFAGQLISKVEVVDLNADQRRHEVTVSFMGLVGPSGVLPSHYSDMVLARSRQKDHATQDFLDLFHHRLVSLFYRSWEKYRAASMHEHPQDRYTQILDGLAGTEYESQRKYAGLWRKTVRSASALQTMLSDYLGTKVFVEQFCGHWVPLRAEDRTRLLKDQEMGLNRLGHSAALGSRAWSANSQIRIHVGPVDQALFRSLLPGQERRQVIEQWVADFVQPHLKVQWRIIPLPHEKPVIRLDHQQPQRLGGDAWLAPAASVTASRKEAA